MEMTNPLNPTPRPVEALDASFDLVARQDATEQAVDALRTDVEDVKVRLDRVSRAAARPVLEPAQPTAPQPGTYPAPGAPIAPASSAYVSPEYKGFVDGYLRRGRETELKSISGAVPTDGGYAVPREIDAMISARLKNISPIRSIAQVVQTGTAGYRKLVTTGRPM